MAKKEEQLRLSLSPTKEFFISTLTRDISLEDAVLDLIDNCIDGVLRSISEIESPKAYKGFWIQLQFSSKKFSIADNCGGIDDPARAFRIGIKKEETTRPTIGTYGIGMKRALFKLGTHCKVKWQRENEEFEVEISPIWFDDETDWELKGTRLDHPSNEDGTSIEVNKLLPQVAEAFGEDQAFVDRFTTLVAQHYGAFLEKGLVIKVNGSAVSPTPLTLRSVPLNAKYETGIGPYAFQATIDGVEVDIILGFYKAPADIVDEEDDLRTSADEAGWTILCNDRVVVYRDKTMVTGWGEADVPAYHPQFSTIAGVVRFRSTKPRLLPLTTTKRGIDGASAVYLQAKDRMRQGLKRFTSFTNRFKKDAKLRKKFFKETRVYNLSQLRSALEKVDWKADRKLDGKSFMPALPQIEKADSKKTIRFARDADEIAMVSEFLFDDGEIDRNLVGEECFTRVLSEAQQ